MGALFLLGLLVGVDNLLVASALGLTPLARRRRWLLVACFGVAEAVMPIAGAAFGSALRTEWAAVAAWIGPACLALCGALALLGARFAPSRARLVRGPWLAVGLPVALSFDNLFAGAALGALGFPAAVGAAVVGLLSAAMCFVGLAAGDAVLRRMPAWSPVAGGAALLALAVVFSVS